MDHKKLLAALRRLKVQTGSLACLGCGYEHACGVHGCAIIREAVEQLKAQHLDAGEPLTEEQLRKMHFDRVWIVYPPQYEGDPGCREEGVVLYGKLYSIDALEGAGFEAVSYTHLDVYKRQRQETARKIFHHRMIDAGVPTQKALGERVGMDRQVIARRMQRGDWRLDELAKVQKVLRFTPEDLMAMVKR